MQIPTPVAGALAFIFLAMLLAAFGYGISVERHKLFPYRHLAEIEEALSFTADRMAGEMPWYYRPMDRSKPVTASRAFSDDRLNLVTAMGADNRIKIMVIDAYGAIRNSIDADWFEIWPDADHVPVSELPKTSPGTHVHGAVMLPDGDVVFNFEQLALVRMTPCGEVVWRLPYRTHHSVFQDESGQLWVSGQITHTEAVPEFPNHRPPFRESIVLKVSPNGEILEEISVFDVLVRNDLRGYLHLVTASNRNTVVSGDTLHLNDVETFPSTMEEGVFRHGDIMISLRNVSSVLVFDPATLEVRYIATGMFTRQHDPEFVDGNTISVFDNNTIGPRSFGHSSRILLLSADTGNIEVYYEGDDSEPFYTDIMGKHQWLDSGNLLVTSSRNGRAFELDTKGRIIWEYFNLVDDGVVGIVTEVQRLPAGMTSLFAEDQALRCSS